MESSSSVFDVLRECGSLAFLSLLVAMFAFVAGAAGLLLVLTRSRGSGWIFGAVAVLGGLGAISLGLIGRQWNLTRLEAALSSPAIPPDQLPLLRAQGYKEANGCIKVGFATGTAPFLLGALAVGIGLAARKKSSS